MTVEKIAKGYSLEEVKLIANLMDKFDEKNIPFTVAVIDMDWHQVDVDPKYGSGWTGYTCLLYTSRGLQSE